MQELMTITGNTISSKLIAEITGKQHRNVMQDIRSLVEQLNGEAELKFQLSYYVDVNNKQQPMYELTRKEALLLASGYNAVLRLKIIDKLEEFTNAKPRTHLEVLDAERALLIANEKAKALLLEANIKIEEDKSKVVFADSVIGSSNSILVRQFAKDLCDDGFEIGEKRLFEWFRSNKYLNCNNEPYQNFVSQGLFEVITRAIGSGLDTFTSKTTKITGKGSVYFANKIKP